MNVPNYWWYNGLLIVSLIIFTFTLWKNKDRKRIIQAFFFITGLLYIFDYLILVILQGYHYLPKLSDSLWFDSTFGSLFSQGAAVPIAAVAIAAFHLRLFWIIAIAVVFMGIEEAFLGLGIYEHYWWRTWLTGALLPIAFYITKYWYRLLHNPPRWVRWITMYCTLSVIMNTVLFFIVLLFETHYYTFLWYDEPIRDHIAGNAIFLFFFMIPTTIVVVRDFSWRGVLILVAIEWASKTLFIQWELLQLSSAWRVEYFVILLLGFIALYRLIFLHWYDKGAFS